MSKARTIQVTPEQLDKTAGTIEGLATDYQSFYKDLYAKMNAMESVWKGKDNVSYISQIKPFETHLQKMKELMDAYAAFLKQSAKAYRDTQQNIHDQAKNLVNG